MKDRLGREITYLRLSVTDRCNMNCVYCRYGSPFDYLDRNELLTWEEMYDLVNELSDFGIRKVRITGGEPLLRNGIFDFLSRLRKIRNLQTIAITTNGFLLKDYAMFFKENGIENINVSLDTLKPERFKAITKTDSFERVWNGIEECLKLNIKNLKINVVLLRGINDDEIIDFVKIASNYPISVRFIELMPLTSNLNLQKTKNITGEEILNKIKECGIELIEEGYKDNSPARYFKLRNGQGNIGLITSMSNFFCSTCNRIRISCDGHLKLCLFGKEYFDLKPHIRKRDRKKGEIGNLVEALLNLKPEHNEQAIDFAMNQIGG